MIYFNGPKCIIQLMICKFWQKVMKIGKICVKNSKNNKNTLKKTKNKDKLHIMNRNNT